MIHFVLVRTRNGRPRLSKWCVPVTMATKTKVEDEVSKRVAAAKPHSTSFVEYGNYQVVFRRYAGLFFIVGADTQDPLLPHYEFIQLLVETLDGYFGNVCELDLVFRFDRALLVLDELLLAGEVAEIDREAVIAFVKAIDKQE